MGVVKEHETIKIYKNEEERTRREKEQFDGGNDLLDENEFITIKNGN